jgi:hypothetical protein
VEIDSTGLRQEEVVGEIVAMVRERAGAA